VHESPTLLDPDDLLAMPGGDSYELIDGRPVEKPMGAKADEIALSLAVALRQYVRAKQLGRVYGAQTGYRCFPGRTKQVRKPDVSFVARGRLPNDETPEGDILIAPDLAVESVSANDTYAEVEVKVQEFLAAGVKLVWVICPASKTVLVRRPGRTCSDLTEADTLSGEDVVPGFSCPVAELFA
jgi:Uma2 family endonuclease